MPIEQFIFEVHVRVFEFFPCILFYFSKNLILANTYIYVNFKTRFKNCIFDLSIQLQNIKITVCYNYCLLNYGMNVAEYLNTLQGYIGAVITIMVC